MGVVEKMSRTELYIVKKEGNLELFKEFGNSHRGAALLWSNLCEKYFNNRTGWLSADLSKSDKMRGKLWKLDHDPRVPRELRILLISTFDHMLIRKENFEKFIIACEEVYQKDYLEEMGHFKIYPTILLEILNYVDCIGIGWNQTSVCSDVWYVYDTCKYCVDGTIQRDYNIFKDNDHNFLFEYLEEIEKE